MLTTSKHAAMSTSYSAGDSSRSKKTSIKEFAEKLALQEYMHPLILINKEGIIQYSLGPCDEYFKVPAGVPDKNIISLFREELKKYILTALQKIRSESKSVEFHNVKIERTGSTGYVDLKFSPVSSSVITVDLIAVSIEPVRILHYSTKKDHIEGMVASLGDISKEYKVRKFIKEAEEWNKYKDLFDQMEHGIALFKVKKNKKGDVLNFRLLEANRAFEDMMGIDLQLVKIRKVTDIFSSPDLRDTIIPAGIASLSGRASNIEFYREESDKYFKMLFFSHRKDFMAAIVLDITLYKKEMQAQGQIASIIESSDDAIYTESVDGKILSWNEGAKQLYGYEPAETVGSNIATLGIRPDETGINEIVMKGNKIRENETVHVRKDGLAVHVSVTKSPIKDEKGRIIAISNIVKDISKLKTRENELVKAVEASEQAASLKALFLSNMSHEIRTPLNAIIGFTDMLKDEVKAGKSKRYVNNIYYSGIQLLNLINDIVDISRLDSGKLSVNMSSVNIGRLLRKTSDQFEGYAVKTRKFNIDFRLLLPDDGDNLHIITDEYRLQQILQNLLSNAFKFTDRGYIEFGCRLTDRNEILFFVKDTGAGINLKYHEKIFERFEQLENDYQEDEKVVRGTGLGLAIARGLAERLGGRMWMESEEMLGSTFYFTIPHKTGEPVMETPVQSMEETIHVPQLGGRNILIADDDPYSLAMLEFMLKDTNINILVARDGQQVLDLFYSEQLDMLLLDIRMPRKDGYQLVKEIRTAKKDIPVIAQSAFALPEHIKKSIETGFDDHLVKPVSRENLYNTLIKYLGGK